MKCLLFTKNNKKYIPFIKKCENLYTSLKIVYPENHPRKRDPSYGNFLKSCVDFNPDIIISFLYCKVIQRDIIRLADIPINFHPSLLPDYGGPHSLNWQIINGEKVYGVTVHKLTCKIDDGKILDYEKFYLGDRDTINDALIVSIDTSIKILNRIKNIDFETFCNALKKNDLSRSKFSCTLRRPEDGLLTKEMSFVEFKNMVRALVSPWPGAYFFKNNEKIRIDKMVSDDEFVSLYGSLIND